MTLPAAPTPALAPEPLSPAVWLGNLAGILGPFVGLLAAAVLLWGWGFRWTELGLMLAMTIPTGLGITVGFHRLFTHRSFETNLAVKVALAVLGSMAVQGPLFKWVAQHRMHHQHSDRPGDPHSPHLHGPGLLGWLRGFWHAHVGWCFAADSPHLSRYVTDLRQSPALRVVSALFPLWVALGVLLPAALGGLLSNSWTGALLGLLWGGLVRIFFVHHVTFSVNSVCHLWGARPYPSRDHSRNNFVVGVLALGEGWHNNHHAFPTSARHGLRWWQIDTSYWFIRALALLHLAWDVKLPTKEAQAQRA